MLRREKELSLPREVPLLPRHLTRGRDPSSIGHPKCLAFRHDCIILGVVNDCVETCSERSPPQKAFLVMISDRSAEVFTLVGVTEHVSIKCKVEGFRFGVEGWGLGVEFKV